MKKINQGQLANDSLGNIYLQFTLEKRLVIWGICILTSFVLYQFFRIQYLVWNWGQFEQQGMFKVISAFFHGWRFDLFAVFTVHIFGFLFGLIPWSKKYFKMFIFLFLALLIFPQVIFILINHGDIEFVNFSGRRMTWEGLFILKEAFGKIGALISGYWTLFFLEIFWISFFIFIVFKSFRLIQRFDFNWIDKKWKTSLVITFILLLNIVSIRGGIQSKPINFVNANVFTEPVLNNLVLNSTFTIIKSYHRETIPHFKFFENVNQLHSLLNYNQPTEGKIWNSPKWSSSPNVILIIVEGLALEYMGKINGDLVDKSYTPFLDSLSEKSLFYSNTYANGKRSIEGIAALISGIPALMEEPFISSNFGTNYFVGLGTLFKKQGYQTLFFHGGHNGTMYFDTFTKSAGYDHYFGFNEFPDKSHDDGTWGIYDGPFLQNMILELSKFKSPFHAAVFTLSSHQPYKIPENLKAKYPDGPIEILKTIRYVDDEIKNFMHEAEKQAWYSNTIFIITADHAQKHFRPEYNNLIGDYKIPLIFYMPRFEKEWGNLQPKKLAQQIDLIPTLMDILHFPVPEVNLQSQNLLNLSSKQVTLYNDQTYIQISDQFYLLGRPNQTMELFEMKNLKSLNPSSNFKEKQIHEDRLKASIQYFSEGMWDNKLYYPSK